MSLCIAAGSEQQTYHNPKILTRLRLIPTKHATSPEMAIRHPGGPRIAVQGRPRIGVRGRRRGPVSRLGPGFRLEFIPMKIGTGMTKEGSNVRGQNFTQSQQVWLFKQAGGNETWRLSWIVMEVQGFSRGRVRPPPVQRTAPNCPIDSAANRRDGNVIFVLFSLTAKLFS